MPRLILASGSSYRRELMERLDLDFEVIISDVDETRSTGESPAALATRLARAKAEAVFALASDAWVIGSDQVIALGDEILSKPGTADRAVEQLVSLAGREHELLTAVSVVSPKGSGDELVKFRMKMRPLDRATLVDYVARDQPLDCAGSYKIESMGIRLFESLLGDDFTAIVGLPLTRVWMLLEKTSFFAPEPA